MQVLSLPVATSMGHMQTQPLNTGLSWTGTQLSLKGPISLFLQPYNSKLQVEPIFACVIEQFDNNITRLWSWSCVTCHRRPVSCNGPCVQRSRHRKCLKCVCVFLGAAVRHVYGCCCKHAYSLSSPWAKDKLCKSLVNKVELVGTTTMTKVTHSIKGPLKKNIF